MSGLTWNRPEGFDPQLAERAAKSRQQSEQDRLRDEFGLSDSDDLEGDFGFTSEAEELRQEIDRLVQQVGEKEQERVLAMQHARRVKEENEKLRRIGIAVAKKHKEEMRVNQQKIQDLQGIVADDEGELEELKAQNALLKAGNDPTKVDMKGLREYKDKRKLMLINNELKSKVKEITARAKAIAEDFKVMKEELNNTRGDLAPLQGIEDKAKAYKTERDALRIDYATSLKSRVRLQGEIYRMMNVLQKNDIEYQVREGVLDGNLSTLVNGLEDSGEAKEDSSSEKPADGASPPISSEAHVAEKKRWAKIKSQLVSKITQLTRALQAAHKQLKAAKAGQPHNDSSLHDGTGFDVSEEKTSKSGSTNSEESSTAVATPSTEGLDPAKAKQLTDLVKSMQVMIKKREAERDALKTERDQIKERAQARLGKASATVKMLKSTLREKLGDNEKLKAKLVELAHNTKSQFSQQGALKEQVKAVRELCPAVQASSAALRKAVAETRAFTEKELAEGWTALSQMVERGFKQYAKRTANMNKEIVAKYRKEVHLRRKYYNMIQELRGNIRVFCRVRPVSSKEKQDEKNQDVCTFPSDAELELKHLMKKTSYNYEFEKVFGPKSTQQHVFAEVSPLIISVLDGYNVCIFAYGQTGSGKTYTMEGPKDNPGIYLRALDFLFSESGARAPTMTYNIEVTLLEIYNNDVRDLLCEESNRTKLRVVHGENGMEVPNLTRVSVTSKDEVMSVLNEGSKNRSVGTTDMNEHSSRSHLILSCYVTCYNTVTGQEAQGKLHLIDLAGSERVNRSGAKGKRLKEAQCINLSLSALGNVISARVNESGHVPYRNSMLTLLLKDSLEKNSKTLMFVQISPMELDVTESLCSLQFAERAKKVELGKAQKNVRGKKSRR